jgi:preprotein translocase SecE subunit
MKFINEVRNEMKFVKWPTKKMVIVSSIAVIVISGFLAVFLGGIDFGLHKLLASYFAK